MMTENKTLVENAKYYRSDVCENDAVLCRAGALLPPFAANRL